MNRKKVSYPVDKVDIFTYALKREVLAASNKKNSHF